MFALYVIFPFIYIPNSSADFWRDFGLPASCFSFLYRPNAGHSKHIYISRLFVCINLDGGVLRKNEMALRSIQR